MYKVETGDTYKSIALKLFGDASLYVNIQAANAGALLSCHDSVIPQTPQAARDSDLYAGRYIIIPDIPGRALLKTGLASVKLPGKSKTNMTLVIAGMEVAVEAMTVQRSIDAAVDAWTASVPWFPGEDKALDAALKPFAYPDSSVFVGGTRVTNGAIYGIVPERSGDKNFVSVEGFSYTADVVDSALNPPYEAKNETLEGRATLVLSPFGIMPTFDFPSGEPFASMTGEAGTKVFDHLYTYAFARGMLVSCTPAGGMLFTRAKTGKSVGTLQEGQPPVTTWRGEFDGRKRYNTYRGCGFSPLEPDKESVASDPAVPRARTMYFSADDALSSDISYIAEWKRSKQVADSISIELPVDDWFAPDGSLWAPNTLVTVISPTLRVPQGFTFLIRSVTLSLAGSARTATLSIVPPGVYAKRGTRTEDPWT